MSTITVYTLEAWDGTEESGYQTQNYQEARRDAEQRKLRVIANEYEWQDSDMVDDCTDEARRVQDLEAITEAGDKLTAEEAAELAGLEKRRH
jgi:hypothetical protein